MTQEAPTEDQAPLNLTELNQLYGADTVSELLQMTVDEAVGLIKDVKSAVAKRDASTLMASAHQLKGLALTMTINKLSKLSLELETAAREDNWDDVPAAQSRLEAEFEHVSRYIKQLLTA